MAVVWMNLKPIINGYFELKKTDIIHKRFKRNTNVFKALSGTTQKFSLKTLQLLQKIELGNPEAKTELRLFLSPSCGHCHKAFEDSYNLLLTFSDKFKLSIYFNVNIENSQNSYSKICEIITQTYLLEGGKRAIELLKDWHINKLPSDSFEKKHIAEISEQAKAMIRSHFNWCKENELNYTPVKIFQETLMPNEYSINDLKYFINELNEENLHHSIAD